MSDIIPDEPRLTFRGQRDGEELVLLVHRHPWALAKPGLIIAIGVAIIVLVFLDFQFSGPSVWTLAILGPALLVYALYSWYIWWNNLYLVTNQRIIVIIQNQIWGRRIEDYSLDKIQSVASDTQGMAGTLLNYGTILLAIMGIKDQVELPFVEDSYSVQEKILTVMKQAEGGKVHYYTDRDSEDRARQHKPHHEDIQEDIQKETEERPRKKLKRRIQY